MLDDKIIMLILKQNYLNGVLILNLLKKPEVKASAKQIAVK